MTEHESWVERTDWRELVTVVLLSVTAVLTAWTGFQASKWGGEMSIAFSQASAARIQAVQADGTANRKINVQVGLFSAWLQAVAADDQPLMDFLADRFPEPLAAAFGAWQATNPQGNPNAPKSPFDMPEYRIPEADQAVALDETADGHFATALDYNQRGDNYTLLAVAFATVLFFAAISSRMRRTRSQWALLSVGLLIFAVAATALALMPKQF